MAKQLNVNLGFTADTSQAKAQIQELQATLSQLAYAGNSAVGVDKQTTALKQASTAAKELQVHLNNAFNAQTGRFDLSKLDKSLKTSGSNLTDLSVKLAGAGTTGQKAFAQLAQSISQANQPMFLLNSRLAEMWTVMKNTMRWQLSSSMIHGFMGTVSQAYGYVQDLNESLNNIRIVTGYSSDQMAVFAKEANKAAKALSTTTTEYTDASLIYYQQGLSDAEVKERTDVTIKMANAAGQSAQTVSDQMTAIWNNFDDGSKSLEYYADVMTALGAATASSTDEIAAGLEKFAAIAETVGLSYEYSTAALATITSTTRQSADVVGNALKTLFARIQGLKLGETLEDGVDLNKYSAALDAVGVQVLSANGELRDMDDILVDLAAKWDTIGKAEQIALAQTVAGVRQYTQLVALMDNWDQMELNLDVAYDAEGTLNEQQKIYEESWQASIDRVKAASEGIYDSLINDKFFIGLNDGFAEILGGVELFIDGIGGAKGAIIALSTILISSLSHKIPQVIDNLVYNFKFLTKGANEAYKSIQDDMNSAFDKTKEQFYVKDKAGVVQNDKEGQPILNSTGTAIKYANELTAARSKLAMVSKSMSNSERQLAEMELSLIEADQQRVVSLKQKNEELQKSLEISQKTLNTSAIEENIDARGIKAAQSKGISKSMSEIIGHFNYGDEMRQTGVNMAKSIIDGMVSQGADFTVSFENSFKKPVEALGKVKIDIDNGGNLQQAKNDLKAIEVSLGNGLKESLGLNDVFKQAFQTNDVSAFQSAISEIQNKLQNITITSENYQGVLRDLFGTKADPLIREFEELIANGAESKDITERLQQLINNFNPTHVVRTSEAFGAMAGMAGTAAMAINSIKSLISTLENPDASGWEKLASILMAFSMIVPGISSAIKNVGTLTSWWGTQTLFLTKAKQAESLATQNNILATKKSIDVKASEVAATALVQAGVSAETGVKVGNETVTLGVALADAIAETGSLKEALGHLKNAGAITAETEAKILNAAVTAKWVIGIIAVIAAVAAVAAVIDILTTSQKEATEAISSANEAYEEEQDKLEDLNSELETTRDRIKELQALDSLTIVEQTELNKLKQSESSLERQIELQERLASLKRQEAANEIAENWEKSAGNIGDEDTAEIYEFDKIGLSPADQAHQESLGRTGYTKAEAEAYVAAKRKEYESAQDVSQLDFTLEDLESWESYIDTAYSTEYADEALSIMENFQTLQDMYNEAKEAGDDKGAQNILDIISDMTSSDQFSKAMEVTYGDDYEKEVLGGFAKENLTSTQMADIIRGRQADFDEDKLALEGINATDLSNYIADGVKALQEENKLTEDQLLTLTPDQLLTLIENQSDIGNTDLSGLDDIGLKNYVDGIQTKTPEQIKQEADAQGVSQAESHELDVDQFKAYRDILYETNDELAKQPELLNQVAIAQLRLNKGADTIKDSYDDLSPLIKKAQKELNSKDGKISAETWSEIATHIDETKAAMEDMFDLDSGGLEDLDPEFLVENYDKLTEAANGSEDAYNQLQAKLASGIIEKNFSGIIDSSEEFLEKITSEKIEAGDLIDFGDGSGGIGDQLFNMYSQAVEAAQVGGASVAEAMAQANELMAAVGFQPPEVEMEAKTITLSGDVPDGWYPQIDGSVQAIDPNGNTYTVEGVQAVPKEGGGYTYTQTIMVPKGGGKIAKSSEKVGGGGGSGGGGGGGGSKREAKTADTGERYHTLTRQLEKIRDEYDELSDAADRAFGPRKLALIDQQIEKLDEEIAKQQELIDAVENYATEFEKDNDPETLTDKQVMEQDFYDFQDMVMQHDLADGITFPVNIEYDAPEGELGNIINYDDIQAAMLDAYNAATESDMTDEEFEEFEKQYEKFFESLSQYEETYDKLREEERKYKELIQQRIDLQLQKVQYEIQIKIDITEDSLELLEFQLDRISDSSFAVAESLALLGQQADLTGQQLDANLQGMRNVLMQATSLDGSTLSDAELDGFLKGTVSVEDLSNKYVFSEEQINLLREYKSAALDNLKTLESLREETESKLTEAFQAWNEELQEGLSAFDHLNATLSSYKNIIGIVGKETLGITKELMNSLNETLVDNAVNQLEGTRKAWEALKNSEKTAEAKLAEAMRDGNQQAIEYWTQMLKDINAEEEAAQETFLSTWENTLTMIVEQFQESAQEAADVFSKSFTASGAPLSEEYEKVQKQNERYIQDYEKIYELSKLTRDINNSINDNNSLAGKAKLKELLKEINAYEEEGVKMSEYDVEYLQKKYDLYQAQIALQEAQNAKDTVRLQRDNEGNYSYVYTQSSDKVEEAQQKYEDALFAVQELNYDYLQEMEAETVSTMDEMQQALLDIKVSDFATLEEYEAEIDRVTKFYMEQIGYYQSEMQNGINRNKELYEDDWATYNRITGYKISANQDFVTSWKETMLGGLINSESETVDIYSRVVDSLDVLIGSLLGAYSTMSGDIDSANEAAGTSTAGFAQTATGAIDEVKDETENAAEAVEDMAGRMESGFDSASTALIKWQTTYGTAMEKAITDTLGVVDAYNLLIKTLTEQKIPTPEKDYGTSYSSGGGNYTGGKKGDKGDENDENDDPKPKVIIVADQQEALYAKRDDPDAIIEDYTGRRYNTGGYTGEWGDDPKWALLDEKEIVLNKEDTSNILNTVSLVRQLTQTIDLNAQVASAGIGKLSAFNFREERESDILQQEVTIHAEFPNVQHRSEIEEAFNNLINVSAQYAHRK